MNTTTHEHLDLTADELGILTELLESERTRLLVEMRHAAHRTFRKELDHRLTVIVGLIERCRLHNPADREERSAE